MCRTVVCLCYSECLLCVHDCVCLITVCNSSCGKVMFSQVCVKCSFHMGGGDMHGWGLHSGGNAWQGVCMVGDGHCSRWYTSYWNAFLCCVSVDDEGCVCLM